MTIAAKATIGSPAQQQYTALVAELGQAIRRAVAHHADRLQCRPGCVDCCRPFSVLAVEAAALRAALAQLPPAPLARIRAQADSQEHCPFLVDKLCTVYQHRPLICRTQGLAIAYLDHDRQAIEVSACPLNFPADEDYEFTEPDLLFMDSFNGRLAEINHDFCACEGLSPEERIPFAAIAGQPGTSR